LHHDRRFVATLAVLLVTTGWSLCGCSLNWDVSAEQCAACQVPPPRIEYREPVQTDVTEVNYNGWYYRWNNCFQLYGLECHDCDEKNFAPTKEDCFSRHSACELCDSSEVPDYEQPLPVISLPQNGATADSAEHTMWGYGIQEAAVLDTESELEWNATDGGDETRTGRGVTVEWLLTSGDWTISLTATDSLGRTGRTSITVAIE